MTRNNLFAICDNQNKLISQLFISAGAREFARWKRSVLSRIVRNVTSTTVFISYDDGDTIALHKIDSTVVILDHPWYYSEIHACQRVIGFWPGRTMYYPGVVTHKRISDNDNCYQKAVHHVVFDDGDQRLQDSLQIRPIPCTTSQELNVENIWSQHVKNSTSKFWLQILLTDIFFHCRFASTPMQNVKHQASA